MEGTTHAARELAGVLTAGQAEALGVGKVEKRNPSPSTACQQEAVYSVPLLLALGFCLMQRQGTRQQVPKAGQSPHVLQTEARLATLSHPALLIITAWPALGC